MGAGMLTEAGELVKQLAPVLIAILSVVGAWIGLRHAEAKRRAEIAAASDPRGIAVVAGGMLAERDLAQRHIEATEALASAVLSLVRAHEGREMREIAEQIIEMRRSLDDLVHAIRTRGQRGE